MHVKWKNRFALGLVLVASLVGLAREAQANVRVGGWSMRANGQVVQNFTYTGGCPVDLQFGWGLLSNQPAQIAYSFSRSDGGHGQAMNGNIPNANQTVTIYDDWRLGAATPQFHNYKGWVELNLNSPNPINKKVQFTVQCR